MPGEVDRLARRVQKERERQEKAARGAARRSDERGFNQAAAARLEAARLRARTHPVKVGQVWASSHAGDVEEGKRQHREVTDVVTTDGVTHARVVTIADGERLPSQMVRCTKSTVKGHRLVSEPPA
jgi:hypothetical protein